MATDIANVVFAPLEADSGNYASVSDSYAGGVYIYAKAVPSGDITIPTILIQRGCKLWRQEERNAKASAGGEPIPAWKDPLWVDINQLYEDNYNFDTWTPTYNYRTFALISASDNETVLPQDLDYQTSDGVWYTGGQVELIFGTKSKDLYDSNGTSL